VRHHVDVLNVAVTVTSRCHPEMIPMVSEKLRKKA
jgi:hypothetical protein